MPGYRVHICSFSGNAFDRLTSRERGNFDRVRAAVLEDGGFSAFDATETARVARVFDRLGADPTLVMTSDCYPWVKVEARA